MVLTLEVTDRHTAARDPLAVVESHWLVVLARVWRDGDRQMIRLIARTESDDVGRVAVESSNRAAADRLLAWLDDFERTNYPGAADDKTEDIAEMTE